MTKLNFLTAGMPSISKSALSALDDLKKLNLDGMELEYVHGVRKNLELAQEIKKIKQKTDLVLTAHGPYYVNLNATEELKIKNSVRHIVETAEQASNSGAFSFTFHAGFYLGTSKESTYKAIKKNLSIAIKKILDKDLKIWIRPETTGKESQFGNLEEIISLSQELENVMPCVDFSHLHARYNGKYNTKPEFEEGLNKIENGLGKEALNNMHIHLSGINYTAKGERNHLILKESDMNYKDLLKTLKEYKVKGALVCESPNIEIDTAILKKYYSLL